MSAFETLHQTEETCKLLIEVLFKFPYTTTSHADVSMAMKLSRLPAPTYVLPLLQVAGPRGHRNMEVPMPKKSFLTAMGQYKHSLLRDSPATGTSAAGGGAPDDASAEDAAVPTPGDGEGEPVKNLTPPPLPQ